MESPEINAHSCGNLIFDKGGERMQWKKTVSSEVVLSKLDNDM